MPQYTEAELNPTLQPCPCCGGDPAFIRQEFDKNDYMGRRPFWTVVCKVCGLSTPTIANPKSPAAIWSKRI